MISGKEDLGSPTHERNQAEKSAAEIPELHSNLPISDNAQ